MLKLTGKTLVFHSVTLPEPPLRVFSDFVEKYNAAFSLLEEGDTLAMAWATNPSFRTHLIAALVAYGVPMDVLRDITQTELTQLVLTSDGKPGLIFQQNDCYPKLLPRLTMRKNLLTWTLRKCRRLTWRITSSSIWASLSWMRFGL